MEPGLLDELESVLRFLRELRADDRINGHTQFAIGRRIDRIEAAIARAETGEAA